MQIDLDTNVQFLKGVGPSKALALNRLEIYTVYDLLMHFPRNYEDRTKSYKIANFEIGQNAVFIARTVGIIQTQKLRNRLQIHKQLVKDETGTCLLYWYNQNYITDKIIPGAVYVISGIPQINYGRVEIDSPIFVQGIDVNMLKGIVPVYSITNGITKNYMYKLIKEIIDGGFKFELKEYLKDDFRKKYNLCDINFAIKQIHMPTNMENANIAKKRLIFEELFLLQLALLSIKNNSLVSKKSVKFTDIDVTPFLELIPFKLTNAQTKVVNEITCDMQSDKIMNRLIQGDVGSGKTIVAALGLYIAVKNGYQGAMMAPTTILASQHYLELKKYFDMLNIHVELLTGTTTKKQKKELSEKLAKGEIDILIGTHALIEESVEFKNLGLVITDEQHRFGVKQRVKLTNKGIMPDTLVMTATPIPRTLAIMLYGDLDLSIIDELPPGRKIVKTYAVPETMEERIDSFIAKQIDEGRQVYVVCPLVEESEELDLKAAVEVAKKYKEVIFKDYNVEYLHGKMKNKEKDEVMTRFKEGKIDVLISTTVIEVGVNVPNATVMVVENAERFGLAQLHQLRGRVGRGNYQSYCVLKTASKSRDSLDRLKVMEECSSGFEVAQKDLELRGPGDFFGNRQSGLPEFKIANLLRDVSVVKEAQIAAKEIILKDPKLELKENAMLREKIEKNFGERLKSIGT